MNVHTTTPVLSVSTAEGVNIVSTPRGDIRAKKVVYTTNAYTFGLLPEYEPAIIPAKGIVAHISVPRGTKARLLSQTYIIRPDASDGADYMIVRPDGSIIIGGAHQIHTFLEKGPAGNTEWFGNIDDSTLIESTKEYWDGYMQRYFKGWEDTDAKVEELWTGSMRSCCSRNYMFDANQGRSNGLLIRLGTTHRPSPFSAKSIYSSRVQWAWYAGYLLVNQGTRRDDPARHAVRADRGTADFQNHLCETGSCTDREGRGRYPPCRTVDISYIYIQEKIMYLFFLNDANALVQIIEHIIKPNTTPHQARRCNACDICIVPCTRTLSQPEQ